MQTISKSELETDASRVFSEIAVSGEELIVTDGGVPAFRIQPIDRRSKKSVEELFGHLQGKVAFHGDPDAPTIDEWTDV